MKIKFDPVFVGIVVFYCLIERSVLPLYVVAAALVHEMGHLIAMKALKCPIKSFEIQPVGFKIVANDSYNGYIADAVVAFSGPLVNLLSAAVIYIGALIAKSDTAAFGVTVNLSLFAMNILPIKVLDGGRILYALLAYRVGLDTAEALVPKISLVFSISLVLAGAAVFAVSGYNFSLLLIGIYLLVSGRHA